MTAQNNVQSVCCCFFNRNERAINHATKFLTPGKILKVDKPSKDIQKVKSNVLLKKKEKNIKRTLQR